MKERKHLIGGSDIGDILELEPYNCRRRKWYELKEKLEGVEREKVISPHMKRGIALEEVAAKEFAQSYGYRLRRVSPVTHPKYPFIGVSPDRYIVGKKDGPGYVEIKCPSRHVFLSMPDRTSLNVQAQVQHGFWVTGKVWGYIVVFCADLWDLAAIPVLPNKHIIDYLEEVEVLFYESLQSGEVPSADAEEKKCRFCPYKVKCAADGVERAKALQLEIEREKTMCKISPSENLLFLLDSYFDLKNIKEETERGLEKIKGEILEELPIKEHKKIEVEGKARIILSEYERSSFDLATFRQKYPDIYKKFIYKKPVQRLSINPITEVQK